MGASSPFLLQNLEKELFCLLKSFFMSKASLLMWFSLSLISQSKLCLNSDANAADQWKDPFLVLKARTAALAPAPRYNFGKPSLESGSPSTPIFPPRFLRGFLLSPIIGNHDFVDRVPKNYVVNHLFLCFFSGGGIHLDQVGCYRWRPGLNAPLPLSSSPSPSSNRTFQRSKSGCKLPYFDFTLLQRTKSRLPLYKFLCFWEVLCHQGRPRSIS